PKKLHEIQDDEAHTADPNFWNDNNRAQAILKSIKGNKKWVSEYNIVATAYEDLAVLFEFFQEGETEMEEVEQQAELVNMAIENLESKSTLTKEEDPLNVQMTINAGAGGTEANDWAEMIMRMYLMWGEKNGYKVRELNRVDGDVAGVKSVDLEFSGDFAYGYLKAENGVHRLVRISPFNAQGKRQTSFASVFVFPVVDDTIDIVVNPADLDWDTFRASGAGGQHVNKTESAVRVRHLPSGLVVECQDERSQHRNRETAITMLKSRLYQLEIEKRNAARDETEAGKMKIEWGSQIRSYVLDDRRVKDHRTNYQTGNTDAVLNGDLNAFIKAYLLSDFNR
ncbi:UNVERIFIED_CONTAM: hypothetical protein GTU68_023210, partial [Idotea baltica]|nr:hypothetical protein [Idotea baltica]